MIVWRIAAEAPAYRAVDLTGSGAKITGGRWNSAGRAMLYCSTSIALAALETVVHLSQGGLPFNRYLVRIEIPDAVWLARQVITAATAPSGWDAVPAGMASIQHGDQWLAGKASAILEVPSIVVPEEQNALINPEHGDASGITAKIVRKWLYDPRCFESTARRASRYVVKSHATGR